MNSDAIAGNRFAGDALAEHGLDEHWPIGEVQQVRPLGGGSINGAYRVQSSQGTFHLRVYRDPRLERAEREVACIRVALQAGVPTPAPIPTRTGALLAQLELNQLGLDQRNPGQSGQRWASLFNVAEGEVLARGDLTAELVANMGTFLAELHDRLPRQIDIDVPRVGTSSVERTILRLERIEAAILALPAHQEQDEWALQRTRQRLAHLRASPLTDYTPHSRLRFLHGDYHEGNLFFRDKVPVSIVDWEQARLVTRAWEVVRTLHLSLNLRPAWCTPFVAAYRERLPLATEELQDGAQHYATLQERNVWTYESVYLEGNPGPRAFIRPPPYVPFQDAWEALGLV